MSGERTTTRPLALGEQGMAATPHYLASITALRVLLDGGNAVDAAVAASAVLCVVYPHMAGIGGDLVALVWNAQSGSLRAFNGAGRSGGKAAWQALRERGLSAMPIGGGLSVTVPGTVDGWARLVEAEGTRSLAHALAPAVAYANGAPLVGTVADRLTRYATWLREHHDARPFVEGQRFAQPALAETLRRVSATGPSAFYTGEIARSLVKTIHAAGGDLDEADFAAHAGNWEEPIFGTFRGTQVAEMAPSTQGVTALEAMALLDAPAPPATGVWDPARIHLAVESTKVAMADRNQWVGDPAFGPSPVARLLDADYLRTRRVMISPDRAGLALAPTIPPRGDTVFMATADREGNLVALVQSLYSAFGSGVMDAQTGVLLHNRGSAFSLEPDSPNRLEPRKRPLHTLIPAMALRDGTPWLVFGCMGGDGQPQTHLQLLVQMLDHGMDVQSAIEHPRWLTGQWDGDEPLASLHLESRFPEAVVEDLARRGHPIIRASAWDRRMGHAQAIAVDHANGFLQGGADPRGDGIAVGW